MVYDYLTSIAWAVSESVAENRNMPVITITTYLIVLPLAFLAGVVDSIAGGGGLISLPAYLIAGVPVHYAIATNKMGSTFGTYLTLGRFIRNGLVNFRLGIPSVIVTIIGSTIGSRLSLSMDETILRNAMLVILPIVAFLVLNKHIFKDYGDTEVVINARTLTVSIVAAFVIGIYDGLYGPGTGTFLIIAFSVFGHLGIVKANGQTKLINAASNSAALVVFLRSGNVLMMLGISAVICNMLGNYVGSGLALRNGATIVKPCILFVLALLFLKVVGVY